MSAIAKVLQKAVTPVKEFVKKPPSGDPFYNDLARRREVNARNRPSGWIPRRPGWLAGHPRERW